MNDPAAGTEEIPVLAIVGHPNKGKSSIVSTLAQDASVQISPRSGTTTHNRAYPIRVDGSELCRLVDTPGFQRPRAAMDWMQRHSRSSADHQETVRRFVETHRDDARFGAECELLTPILAGRASRRRPCPLPSLVPGWPGTVVRLLPPVPCPLCPFA